MTLIRIPDRFRETCTYWHGGQASAFYAASSSGTIPAHMLYNFRLEAKDCQRSSPGRAQDCQLSAIIEWCKLIENVVDCGAELLSEEGENREYDRAIIEFTCEFLGVNQDGQDEVAELLRSIKEDI